MLNKLAVFLSRFFVPDNNRWLITQQMFCLLEIELRSVSCNNVEGRLISLIHMLDCFKLNAIVLSSTMPLSRGTDVLLRRQ